MATSKSSSGMIGIAKDLLHTQARRPSLYSSNQDYLTGLRGILVIQSFIWLFFQIFVPALVTNPDNEYASQPTYQVVLRKLLSPLLWDGTLIYSFFIILSARTVGIHFLQDATTPKYARTLISRPIRIGLSISIALALSITIFSTIDTSYISKAAFAIKSSALAIPAVPESALVGANSIYDLLWVYRDFSTQMGNQLWPSGTFWVVSLIYFQSWTVYILMVILPYTRPGWHMHGVLWFSLGSFWFNTWGWYSAMGLLIADLSLNPALRAALDRGMPLPKTESRLPYLSLAMVIFGIGACMKYIWIAGFPQHFHAELHMHPARYLQPADGLGNLDPTLPYPRLDNYLVIFGVLLGLEVSQSAQYWLSGQPLQYLGSRSLSIFFAQCLIMYTAGLKFFVYLYASDNMPTAGANALVFLVCLPATLIGGEIFHRVIDQPSQWAGAAFFRWTRN